MEILRYGGAYIQLLSLIISLCYFYKYSHTPLKWLPVYLGIVAFIEILCFHFYQKNNVWLYNLVTLIQINFYCFLFYQYLEGISRKITLALWLLYDMFFLGYVLIDIPRFLAEMVSIPHVISIVILIIVLIMMFNQMLKIENFEGFTKNLMFWLCFSLLIFHATSLPLFSITRWSETVGEFKMSLIKILIFSLLVTHAILIFGFIWSKKKYTY